MDESLGFHSRLKVPKGKVLVSAYSRLFEWTSYQVGLVNT